MLLKHQAEVGNTMADEKRHIGVFKYKNTMEVSISNSCLKKKHDPVRREENHPAPLNSKKSGVAECRA